MYVPYEVTAGIFTGVNAFVSVACWLHTSRRTMLITGGLNSLVGAFAIYVYPFDYKLSNFNLGAASLCAGGQYVLHGMRTPHLMQGKVVNALYWLWVLGLFGYSYERFRWVRALKYD
ncbi:hypothetical protein AGDE_03536 [Angomonas deanei]|uniref:Uncharacterized protein n=1 Tax=Angomonas deanei TaxID=59799 RepID=S9VX53_9TRYP|nr:hypothetical protein AGDE_10523 [Angomonas deanei]EPY39063.1 hypothetical protein AGDE_04866 [Angomonas deanei]EPY40392.1 hypothetical protein AGDE_03536 [Angomonas deanei]CAD2216036.1 hypothetical protein, conserved [Angomonas deanei]|eukprot:EPY28155.1 hypothetical protein AGDE_10523 [Angomonas deanei]